MKLLLIFSTLTEGLRGEPVARIALRRRGVTGELLDLLDEFIIVQTSDVKVAVNLPLIDINQPVNVVDFVENWLKTSR